MQQEPTRRQRWERRQRRRSIAVAALSSTTALVAVVLAVPRLPGYRKVRAAFFDGEIFVDTFGPLARAFLYDLQIFAWCAPAILMSGMAIALARTARSPALFPLRVAATVYTDGVRGVPVVLWIYLIGFGVPGLLQSRTWSNPVLWGSTALIVAYSAYVAEVFRAGIESVHESQRAAARSLGLSNTQTLRHVVLPQAVRRVIPPLMNDLVSLQKDVALVSFLGPVEALRRAQSFKSSLANFTPYVGAALLFLCVSVPLTRLTDHLLQRERRRMSATAIR
ncbi:MAG: ABC transporter permease subunit [Acidimicrobiales bacterium]|nr:ABC transporter permease subunit [Acidimicrobiales bacterium]